LTRYLLALHIWSSNMPGSMRVSGQSPIRLLLIQAKTVALRINGSILHAM
jgi:hypothetical protein